MGKTRRKERSEAEYLRGQVRKLESENRQLKKRVKQLDRKSHFYENLVDEGIEEVEFKAEKCPVKDCEGFLVLLDLKHVRFDCCTECEYRKRL